MTTGAHEIRVFVAETQSSAPLPQNLPPNTFTKRVSRSSGNSVILFDNLMTGLGDPEALDGAGFGVQKVLEVLRKIPEGERIANEIPGLRARVPALGLIEALYRGLKAGLARE